MLTSLVIFLSMAFLQEIAGHGMLLEPPNRSSLWRFDDSAPINPNDDYNYCGPYRPPFDGNCGVCGDQYDEPHPQPNENTGIYGKGTIVANYSSGAIIRTHVQLTINHPGHFEFDLCKLKDPKTFESGEECFKQLYFDDGLALYQVRAEDEHLFFNIQLPNVKCKRCVLRWNYYTTEDYGENAITLGYGKDGVFRSCADVSIV